MMILMSVDGNYKRGIYKENWGKVNKYFHHLFPIGSYGLHFNAKKVQELIFDKIKDQVSIKEGSFSAEELDADYVIDCSGKRNPNSVSLNMTVNSVFITQCYWDKPEFDYTLTIARPYGWVFGIPLQNRCSIGYLYNKDINSLEEVQEDVKNIFSEWNLTPSDTTANFDFDSYYTPNNFSDRIIYNGDASFFLEPLEATTTSNVDYINRLLFNQINGITTAEQNNFVCKQKLMEI